jgi:hypothetical protein
MSGKLNELISLFVGDADASPCGADQWRIKAQPTAGPRRVGFFDRALNPCEDKLTGGAPFPGSGFTDTTVKVAGQIDGSADRGRFHMRHYECVT